MGWFTRHLNWTIVLSALIFNPIIMVAAASSSQTPILSLGVGIVALALWIPICVWVVKRKHRNWMWVLVVPFTPIGIGWLILIVLRNHKEVYDIQGGRLVTIERQE